MGPVVLPLLRSPVQARCSTEEHSSFLSAPSKVPCEGMLIGPMGWGAEPRLFPVTTAGSPCSLGYGSFSYGLIPSVWPPNLQETPLIQGAASSSLPQSVTGEAAHNVGTSWCAGWHSPWHHVLLEGKESSLNELPPAGGQHPPSNSLILGYFATGTRSMGLGLGLSRPP